MAECSLSVAEDHDVKTDNLSWLRDINNIDSSDYEDDIVFKEDVPNPSLKTCSACSKVLCADKSTSVTGIDSYLNESVCDPDVNNSSVKSKLSGKVSNDVDKHSKRHYSADDDPHKSSEALVSEKTQQRNEGKAVTFVERNLKSDIVEANRRNLVGVSEVNLPNENLHIERQPLGGTNNRHPFRRTLSNSIIEVPTFAHRLEPQFIDVNFVRDIHLQNNPEIPDDIFLLTDRRPVVPSFPQGDRKFTECQICYDLKELHLRICCHLAVCDDCLTQYFNTQVVQGITRIQCLQQQCKQFVHRDEILGRLSGETKDKFYRFLVDANKDPNIKTCPRCSHITSVATNSKSNSSNVALKVVCSECDLVWCFPCQAPWHEGVSCREFRLGDKLLRNWAKEFHYGQQNAQKCPKCKVYIQRTTGCDHMSCARCATHFCYRCGERYRWLKFVGDHYSKLSILGCKYRFKPDKPVQRKFIRGSIFGGKLAVAPVVGGVALGVGAVLLAFGVLVLPFYGSYRLHKKLKREKNLKRALKHREKMRRKLDLDYKQEQLRAGSNVDKSCPLSYPEDLEDLEISQLNIFDSRLKKYKVKDRQGYNHHLSMTLSFNMEDDHSSISSDSDDAFTVTEVKVINERVKDRDSDGGLARDGDGALAGDSDSGLTSNSNTDGELKSQRKISGRPLANSRNSSSLDRSENDTASLDRIVEDMMRMTEDISVSGPDELRQKHTADSEACVNEYDETTAL